MIPVMRTLLTIAALATTAHADIWRHAIEQGSPDVQQDIYESEMKSGDELALQATSTSVSSETIRQLVTHAALSYQHASTAKPASPEPYYRLGRLLYAFYLDCTTNQFVVRSPLCPKDDLNGFDAKHAKEVIDAWDTFEARAPLDPRLGVERDNGIAIGFPLLFHRAVLHTRLATKPQLELAVKDYEKILSRTDLADETVLSNLAETYMMIGRLDDAIDTYRQALHSNRNTETMYGLAVALDRDERGTQAKDVIVAQGEQAMAEFHRRIQLGITFFVPRGEEFYYFALSAEAFGLDDSAIEFWKQYLRSGAHPEFQPRAKAHLDALLKAHTRKAVHLETPWLDLTH
jgi:tetratricopeptide (TPR) repeat protein